MVGSVAYAQQEPPPQAPPAQQNAQPAEDSGSPMVLKGCLKKGTQAQEYVVADDDSGKQTSFAGPAKLDGYVNQTVEISGRVVERGGEKTFQAQALKPVASSCKNSQQ